MTSLEKDVPVKIDGLTYKVGRHGKVFVSLNGEWILSQKTPADIRLAIKYEAKRLAMKKGKSRVIGKRMRMLG